MINSPALRLSIAAIVFIFSTAPGTAGVTIRAIGAGQTAPLPTPSSPPVAMHRFLRINSGVVPLVTPAGCAGNGTGSFVGAGVGNSAAGYAAAVVSGAYDNACDQYAFIGAGNNNLIGGGDSDLSYNAVITGGINNGITGSAAAFIGGGLLNLISNPPNATYYNSNLSFIGAGNRNTIEAPNSFIGSGYSNTILSPSFAVNNVTDSFIGGGYGNSTDADFAFIGGGYTNTTNGEWSSIVGGYQNSIGPSATQAFIGGGYNNSITGRDSTIAGGANNVVSADHSFAAGQSSKAPFSGDFVWSDFSSTSSGAAATGANQFLARASGGFYLYTSPNMTSGVKLSPGSGSWSNLSDRASKTDIVNVDPEHIMTKLASMPVSEWSYIAQGDRVRHLGPMAQDFYTAFGLGEDDKHISTVDEEGVALAAVKALQVELSAKTHEVSDLRAQYAQLAKRVATLENYRR